MEIDNIKADMKLGIMGQRFRAGHAKVEPIGDRMLNAVRGAVREAWEMGRDKGSHEVAPPEYTPEREPEQPEPGT